MILNIIKLNAAESDRSAFICIVQAPLQCVTISSPLWNIFEKWCLKTNPVEWKLKPVTRIYIYEASNKGFVFHPDGLPGLTQPHTVRQAHRRIHTHMQTQRNRSAVKKGKGWRKKTWIPAVVCVLEQVNSLYSRIAITSTLQQGCSWLELNAVWLDQTRGLFFSFFVKMQIWPASHCKNSSCLHSTFPIFVFHRK